MTEFEQHIRASACTREEIDHFLDPDKLSMWQFDAEVGYILGNYLRREGIDCLLSTNAVLARDPPSEAPLREQLPYFDRTRSLLGPLSLVRANNWIAFAKWIAAGSVPAKLILFAVDCGFSSGCDLGSRSVPFCEENWLHATQHGCRC